MENSLKSVIWPLLRKETNALVKILRYSFCEKMKQASKSICYSISWTMSFNNE